MSSIITKISQIDPRFLSFGMFILFGILAPVVLNSPNLPGTISGQ